MTVRIEICSTLDSDQTQHLFHWRERVFPAEGIDKQWSQVSWHLLAFAAGDMPVAHLGFDRFELQQQEVTYPVVGIGGVVVRPECQGLGIPARLFDAVHSQAPQKIGTSLFSLFCPQRLVSYYEKHGYSLHRGEVRFMQSGQEVVSTFCFMHRGGLDVEAPVRIPSPPW